MTMKIRKFKKNIIKETHEEYYLIYGNDMDEFIEPSPGEEWNYDRFDLKDTIRYYLELQETYDYEEDFSIIKYTKSSKPVDQKEINEITKQINMENNAKKYNL